MVPVVDLEGRGVEVEVHHLLVLRDLHLHRRRGLVCTRMNGGDPAGRRPGAARRVALQQRQYELYCSTSSARCAFFCSIRARARLLRAEVRDVPVPGRGQALPHDLLRFAMMFIAMAR